MSSPFLKRIASTVANTIRLRQRPNFQSALFALFPFGCVVEKEAPDGGGPLDTTKKKHIPNNASLPSVVVGPRTSWKFIPRSLHSAVVPD